MNRPRALLIAAAALLFVPIAVLAWIAVVERFTSPAHALHRQRGEAAMSDGRYADAVVAFSRARELAPGDGALDLALTRARVYAAADDPARVGDRVDDLRYDAELLLAVSPDDAAACHTALGHARARAADPAGARAKYEEAVRADPRSPLARTALGMALLGDKERAGQATTELEAALAARPGHPGALLGLGQAAMQKGQPAEAVRHLEAALAARESFAAHLVLGNAHVRLKNLSAAITHFERAAQLDPRSAEALRSLGQALMAADRTAEAERPLRLAAQMDDLEAATGLGFALARQGKHGAALDAFTQALGRDPSSPLATFGAGVALEELGKREEAGNLYRRLIAMQGSKDDQALAQVQEDARRRLASFEADAPPAASASAAPKKK
jgi:tetratricopeptide (TPR) repeat protein